MYLTAVAVWHDGHSRIPGLLWCQSHTHVISPKLVGKGLLRDIHGLYLVQIRIDGGGACPRK